LQGIMFENILKKKRGDNDGKFDYVSS
jgi:hypothetical protein